ncbi:MAG TPA: hypothetical protein VHO24_12715 [Opitutaceae bacterium]|nr:hypothetical protein [Opitutaceae bacterium]
MPIVRGQLQATLAAIIASTLWWHFRSVTSASLAILLVTLALVAWFAPRLYVPVQRTLDRFARGVLAVFTWLVLGLIYFGVFTPVRLWRAVTRHDPLRLRISNQESYFQPLPPPGPRRFDRQF